MSQPPDSRSPRRPATRDTALHAERWLLDAMRRAGHPVAEQVALEASDSAWRVLKGLGFSVDVIAGVAGAASACKAADFTEADSRLAFYMPAAVAERFDVAPAWYRNERLAVATFNPLRMHLEEDLSFACGVKIELLVAPPGAIVAARSKVYPGAGMSLDTTTSSIATAAEPTTVGRLAAEFAPSDLDSSLVVATRELLDGILSGAIHACASDVHFEPIDGGGMIVRLRVDGSLYELRRIPEEHRASAVRRLKVACGINITDTRRPQDGRTTFTLDDRTIDLRISTLPLGGNVEKVSIRILDAQATSLNLTQLGFSASELGSVKRLMQLAEGLVLVTGPTGSGKTSTLYSMLNALRASERNIMTVEDPAEYRLEGVTQVQVNAKAGMTFAAGLRSLLRQYPDVVLVGEIRDLETADVAVKAGMSGHLVFSSLHTADAASAVERIRSMNIDPASLSTALKGVVSQRLVRRLCNACAGPLDISTLSQHHQLLLSEADPSKLRGPNGCPACRGTGYRGRIVVAELFVVTPAMQNAIAHRAPESELSRIATESGMLSMWQSGLSRVLDGTTSLFEMVDNIAPPVAALPTAGQAEVDALVAKLLSKPANATPAAATQTPIAKLPVVEVSSDITAIDSASRGRVPSAQPVTRVLIVDDDAVARRELAEVLSRSGFGVIEAADGESALVYARRLRPTFVLTELAIPKLDGLGLLRALLQEPGAPRVVVYSRQSDPEMLKWAIELGALDAMSRETDARVLCARLRSALESAA
jgi:type II secretory ATPase GspE/PulE/Tfp pilus assembly ATPase PilB-like protein